jgi:hypothetical protein
MRAHDLAIRLLEPDWFGEFALLDLALRAGRLTVEPEATDCAYAARVRTLHDLGLVSQLYRPAGRQKVRTYVITDGGRIVWRQGQARARRMGVHLAGMIT